MTHQFTGRRVNRIDELEQSLPPARDLWPGIAAAIEADRAAAVDRAPRRTRWLPAAGMAAAVALVTVGIFIGRITGQSVYDPTGRLRSGDAADELYGTNAAR